jgi:two-component system phosphate regulon response regulator PhoB
LRIDVSSFEVLLDGRPLDLTPAEFRLLRHLAAHPGRVFTRSQLLRAMAGEDAFLVDRNVDVRINTLRRKLGRYRDWIETVRGVGYRFRRGT